MVKDKDEGIKNPDGVRHDIGHDFVGAVVNAGRDEKKTSGQKMGRMS